MDLTETRLTLRNLRLIDAIMRESSLSGAAASLGLTQSAVTKALQDAEGACGVRLFDRTNRGVIATPYGEVLASHARVVLAQLRHTAQELANLRDGTGGRVTVGTLVSAAVSLLPEAIAQVQADRPNLTITLIEGTNDTLMPLLRTGELDLVVGRLPEFREREGITQEVLSEDRARIVCAPDHPANRLPIPRLADLTGFRWILPRVETTLRRQFDAAFRAQGLDPPTRGVESVSVLANRALISRSGYLSVWPGDLALAEAAVGAVAILPIDLPQTNRPVGISTRSQARLSPAAGLVISALRQIAKRPPSAAD